MLNFPFYCIFPLDLHNRGICRHLLSAQTHNVNLSVSKRIELTRRQRQTKDIFEISIYTTFTVNLLAESCSACVLFSYICLPN